jgi:uncharacterized membrane protein
VSIDNEAVAARAAGTAGARWHRPGLLWTRRPGSAHVYGVGALTALVAALYGVFSRTLYYTFHEGTYDLVIFDQAIRSYAHLQPGYSPAKGLHNFGIANFSVLGDHFSPIDALLAPLYWIANSPLNLLIAQAVLFALAVPPIWVFTRRAFGDGRKRKGTAAAYFVAAAYGISWPLASAAAFDFHEAAFAPPLTALALERLQKGRLKTALVCLAGLLLVKEDMGLYVAGMGLGLAITRRLGIPRQRLTGVLIAAVSLVYTFLAVYVFIPGMGGKGNYYWAYDQLGPDVPSAARSVLTDPVAAAQIIGTPPVKLSTLLTLFAPFLFLSLLSPIVLAAIPLLLERMLGDKFPDWWATAYQYNAYVVVPIAFAAVDGALRLDRWAGLLARRLRRAGPSAPDAPGGWVALGATAVFAIVAVALVPAFPLGRMFTSDFWHRSKLATIEAAAAGRVPSGTVVEAVNSVGPELSGRDTVLLWDGNGATPRYVPWVIADVERHQFTFANLEAQQQRLEDLRKHGYITVFSEGGIVVLHAPVLPSRPREGAARP